ncbi:hypothetical protein L1D13_17890 [Vibrio tubiashii]|uniref:hypothetical protein n=1 Tax=Vibrio tubiashii TaxID=29498 RepID=UPI001EFCF657|nr:hypothetical protein [Vibrio tubiashii]MCG9580567.1 hypothetical protein [Vibrio tubiashii]MCG9614158.1 hypothetical protein [Vibrio tubiashii]MCG9688778.1 hypothetical protein [Vibrio tubiashii]
MRHFITFIALTFLSTMSWASKVENSTIERIHVNSNGFAYIKLEQSRVSPCQGTSSNEYFTIDLATKIGQIQYSHALSIFHTQGKVTVIGTSKCGSPHDLETVGDIHAIR